MNFNNIVNTDPRIKKLAIFWSMSTELESEPALEYAIKLYILMQISPIFKQTKNP